MQLPISVPVRQQLVASQRAVASTHDIITRIRTGQSELAEAVGRSAARLTSSYQVLGVADALNRRARAQQND